MRTSTKFDRKRGSGIYRSSSPENSTFLLFRLWNEDDSTKVNKMASKELFDAAAFLYSEDLVDEEELMFLAKDCEEKAPVFPYWKYPRFMLEEMNEDECISEFRFEKPDLPRIAQVLKIPEKIVCENGTIAGQMEGLCMFLKRFSYPCHLSDMIPRFGRSKYELCLISNQIMRHVVESFQHLLTTFEQQWLQTERLEEYAYAVFQQSQALDNCWGFIDGTVRPICRPVENQKTVYNGHKRVHALKYQAIVAANGLIANLYGPVGKFLLHFLIWLLT